MWEYRPSSGAATELLPLFRSVLDSCAVRPSETVLVYSDPHTPPHYGAAFVSAAQELGAISFELTVPANSDPVETGVILDAFKGSDLVIDLASYGTSIYRPLRTEALKAGTRILRVTEPEDVLFRMPPDPVVRDRAKRSERLADDATSFQITSEGGTDIVVNKEGRKAFGLWGAVDQPGMWDHWPMGLVVVGANRAGTNGRHRRAAGRHHALDAALRLDARDADGRGGRDHRDRGRRRRGRSCASGSRPGATRAPTTSRTWAGAASTGRSGTGWARRRTAARATRRPSTA